MRNKLKPSYYAITPASVRYDQDLPANAKLLYGEITALCNQEGYCWASNSYFAKLYGVTKGTVSRWVSALKDKGYIRVELKYKEDSNQIDQRIIYLSDPHFKKEDTYIEKETYLSSKKGIPITKNDKDNNTSNNTINTKDIYSSSENEPPTSTTKSDKKKKAKQQVEDNFEKMWKLYPEKRGKGRVSYTKKKEIYKLGDEFERCIERYLKDVEKIRRTGFEQLQYKNGSTFFNSGYVDYLDENYEDMVKGEDKIEYDSSGKRIDHRGISVSGIDKDEAETLRQMAERIKQQGRDS